MRAFYLRFGYSRLRPLYVDRRACLGPRVFAKPRISLARFTCVSVRLFIRSFIDSSFLPPQRVPSNASLSRFLILMIRARHRGCRALSIQCLTPTLLCLSLSWLSVRFGFVFRVSICSARGAFSERGLDEVSAVHGDPRLPTLGPGHLSSCSRDVLTVRLLKSTTTSTHYIVAR